MNEPISTTLDVEHKGENYEARFSRLQQALDTQIQTQVAKMKLVESGADRANDFNNKARLKFIQSLELLSILVRNILRVSGSFSSKAKLKEVLELLELCEVAFREPDNKANNEQLRILVEENVSSDQMKYNLYTYIGSILLIAGLFITILLFPASAPVWAVVVFAIGFPLVLVVNLVVNASRAEFEEALDDVKEIIRDTKVSQDNAISFFAFKSQTEEEKSISEENRNDLDDSDKTPSSK